MRRAAAAAEEAEAVADELREMLAAARADADDAARRAAEAEAELSARPAAAGASRRRATTIRAAAARALVRAAARRVERAASPEEAKQRRPKAASPRGRKEREEALRVARDELDAVRRDLAAAQGEREAFEVELAEARAALGRAEAQAAAAEAARSQASERLALRDQEVQALTEQLHKMILSKKEGSERQRRSVFSPGVKRLQVIYSLFADTAFTQRARRPSRSNPRRARVARLGGDGRSSINEGDRLADTASRGTVGIRRRRHLERLTPRRITRSHSEAPTIRCPLPSAASRLLKRPIAAALRSFQWRTSSFERKPAARP